MCLLKESTSAKNDDFRASNSSITESLNFGNSSLTLTLDDFLNSLWLFEYWAPFGKDKQVRVLTSFIYKEWHFVNLSRTSSKCSLLTPLSTDSLFQGLGWFRVKHETDGKNFVKIIKMISSVAGNSLKNRLPRKQIEIRHLQ